MEQHNGMIVQYVQAVQRATMVIAIKIVLVFVLEMLSNNLIGMIVMVMV